MEWVAITAADLDSVLTVPERDVLTLTGLGNDRVEPVLADLTAEIRSMVATHTTNTLSADPTKIPPGFKARALVIARWRLLTTIPDYAPGESRKLEYEKAEAFFAAVAAGKIRPEPADDFQPNDVASEKPAGVQFWGSPSRTGRQRMNGL